MLGNVIFILSGHGPAKKEAEEENGDWVTADSVYHTLLLQTPDLLLSFISPHASFPSLSPLLSHLAFPTRPTYLQYSFLPLALA